MQTDVSLKQVDAESTAIIQAILEAAPKYAMAAKGQPVRDDDAMNVLTAIPHGCGPDQKRVFLIEHHSQPVGVVDLSQDYTSAGTAFIGLLLLAEGQHGKGLGKAAYLQIEHYCAQHLSALEIKIAVLDANPVHEFWRKQGFNSCNRMKEYWSGNVKTCNRVFGKFLR